MNLKPRKCIGISIALNVSMRHVSGKRTLAHCVCDGFDTCVCSLTVNESSVCLQKKHAMLLCQLLLLQSSCRN